MGAGYNGWTNWETWNLYTWLSNDEGTYELARDAASDWELKDLVTEVYDILPDGASPVMDAWNQYLHEVDWEELFKAFVDEEDEPTCDICGRIQGDSPNVLENDQPADWNGETGNHITCENMQ